MNATKGMRLDGLSFSAMCDSRALSEFSYLLFTLVNRCERRREFNSIRGLIARISAKRTVKEREILHSARN